MKQQYYAYIRPMSCVDATDLAFAVWKRLAETCVQFLGLALPYFTSLAFVCVFVLQHLLLNGTEVVKRWVNEVQEAVSSENRMVQVSVTFCK